MRRAPSRQMSMPSEDPYASAFARASSLEPSGYDGLGPSMPPPFLHEMLPRHTHVRQLITTNQSL